jgi:hypothetical protein
MPPVADGEVCDLCAEPISEHHSHLVDVVSRTLKCACYGCSMLFTAAGAGGGHFRTVPDRYLAFPDFDLTPARWDALQIPVGVAFFFLNSELDRVAAFYPGPAGATESLLSLDTWNEIVEAQPTLATLEPDVEAFLVRVGNGPGSVTSGSVTSGSVTSGSVTSGSVTSAAPGGPECYLVPIDACYDLVGRLRRLWRGFDGGSEARQALDEFFEEVAAKARPARPGRDAPSGVPDLEWGDRAG